MDHLARETASGTEPDGAGDWGTVTSYLGSAPTKWNSLSWIAARSLIASTNHVLATRASALVADLRNHWVHGNTDPKIDCAGVTRFLVAGDPGEQDASQYIVAPALARAAAQPGVGFVILLSDVIYPSGDVNDYDDGFYKPYRGTNPSFRINSPIFALPGNHDWYDGLFGFVYHFIATDEDPRPWPDHLVAPTFAPLGFKGRIFDRFARTMWRVPGDPCDDATDARTAAGEIVDLGQQPAPYFKIATEHVDLVCIDTGIDGTVDSQQLAWLERLDHEKPKILMTGKPLVVNGRIKKSDEPGATDEDDDPIYTLVTETNKSFVATVGGDVHNFQHYVADDGLHHFVSGGAGAYTHATHPIRTAALDLRVDQDFLPEGPLFPEASESLSYFASQLVPSVWRMVRTVLWFAVGIGLGWVAATHDGWGVDVAVRSQLLSVGPGAVGVVALLGLVLVHHFGLRSGPGRGRRLRHGAVGLEALVAGGLVVLFLHAQLPAAADRLLVLYATSVGWLCLNGWGLRRSRWWSSANEPAWWQHLLFVLGVTVSAALMLIPAGVELLLLEEGSGPVGFLMVAVALYWLVVVGGWLLPRVGGAGQGARQAWWSKNSVWVATTAQLVVVSAEMWRVMNAEGLRVLFFSGLAGVGLGALVVVVALVIPFAADDIAVLFWWRHPWREAVWRWCSRWTRRAVFLSAPVCLGLWALWADGSDDAYLKAAFALPALVAAVVMSALAIDAARRRYGGGYKVGVGVVVAAGGVLVLGAVVPGLFAVPGYELPEEVATLVRSSWPTVGIAAAACTALVVGVAIVAAHLVFLRAYWLLLDWGRAHTTPRYGDAAASGGAAHWDFISKTQAKAIIAAEQKRVGGQAPSATVPWKVRHRAQIAFPGLNPPFGPIQKFVSEIYSIDEPPFFKHFLEFVTDAHQVTVFIHRVRGDQAVEVVPVVSFSLRRGQGDAAEDAHAADQITS